MAVRRFEKFMNETAKDIGIMGYGTSKLTDQEAKLAIQKTTGIASPLELQSMEKRKTG